MVLAHHKVSTFPFLCLTLSEIHLSKHFGDVNIQLFFVPTCVHKQSMVICNLGHKSNHTICKALEDRNFMMIGRFLEER